MSVQRLIGQAEDDQEDAPEEVPEARLGDDLIGRKDAHAIDFGSRLGLGGEVAAHDLVFLEAHAGRSRDLA